MSLVDKYLIYISTQKRYSQRTRTIYSDSLECFFEFAGGDATLDVSDLSDDEIVGMLHRNVLRAYQLFLLDQKAESPRTVNLHLSVLSSFCRFLVKQGTIKSNPVSTVTRPKQSKRLPVFFRQEAMEKYLRQDNALIRRDFDLDMKTEAEKKDTYRLCLDRVIVSILYSTGIRRSELIGLRVCDVDLAGGKMRVRGKGDKMREIPLTPCVIDEISLYLQSLRRLAGRHCCDGGDPLLVTWSGGPLYPVLVDRAVKSELGPMGNDFAGRKSPHVLRHSLATALMEDGADIDSIKEVLGHANLAATQIYTHSNAQALKKIYNQAHPRAMAKDDGKNSK